MSRDRSAASVRVGTQRSSKMRLSFLSNFVKLVLCRNADCQTSPLPLSRLKMVRNV
jgi:hypothetical protein